MRNQSRYDKLQRNAVQWIIVLNRGGHDGYNFYLDGETRFTLSRLTM